MTDLSPRNSFRAAVLRGERKPLVVEEKQPRLDSPGDALKGALVSRSEARRGNHRDQDRHRLTGESAQLRHDGGQHEVELINLSAGGAMIRAADFAPHLWDMVELELGEGTALEAAVRWVKDDCVGLEFAHETRIECDPEMRAQLLLDVIQRSFPDLEVELEVPEEQTGMVQPVETSARELGKRAETRHPMVWSGQILFAFDSSPVRLRNVSSGGALVDVEMSYPVGSEVVLDLGEAGQFEAVVTRMHGQQAGLRFAQPFDLGCLARLRPDLTPYRWERPSFLDASSSDAEDSSPWAEGWGRSSLAALRDELEGYLKH